LFSKLSKLQRLGFTLKSLDLLLDLELPSVSEGTLKAQETHLSNHGRRQLATGTLMSSSSKTNQARSGAPTTSTTRRLLIALCGAKGETRRKLRPASGAERLMGWRFRRVFFKDGRRRKYVLLA
jgi:hypothetical protein